MGDPFLLYMSRKGRPCRLVKVVLLKIIRLGEDPLYFLKCQMLMQLSQILFLEVTMQLMAVYFLHNLMVWFNVRIVV